MRKAGEIETPFSKSYIYKFILLKSSLFSGNGLRAVLLEILQFSSQMTPLSRFWKTLSPPTYSPECPDLYFLGACTQFQQLFTDPLGMSSTAKCPFWECIQAGYEMWIWNIEMIVSKLQVKLDIPAYHE